MIEGKWSSHDLLYHNPITGERRGEERRWLGAIGRIAS
jgi:hypothetical protein